MELYFPSNNLIYHITQPHLVLNSLRVGGHGAMGHRISKAWEEYMFFSVTYHHTPSVSKNRTTNDRYISHRVVARCKICILLNCILLNVNVSSFSWALPARAYKINKTKYIGVVSLLFVGWSTIAL